MFSDILKYYRWAGELNAFRWDSPSGAWFVLAPWPFLLVNVSYVAATILATGMLDYFMFQGFRRSFRTWMVPVILMQLFQPFVLPALCVLGTRRWRRHSSWNWWLEKLFNGIWEVEPVKICQADYPVVPVRTLPKIQQDELEKIKVDYSVSFWRDVVGMLAFVGVVIMFVAGAFAAVCLVAVLLFVYTRGNRVRHVAAVKPGETSELPLCDGLYQLRVKIFGIRLCSGAGVVYEGVMHTCHHVAGSAPLLVEGNLIYPTYVDPKTDLTTWGGGPRIVSAKDGEEVLVRVITPEGFVVDYASSYSLLRPDVGVFWAILTRAGASGSPVFVKRNRMYEVAGEQREAPTWHLVGLIGNNMVRDNKFSWQMFDNYQVEFILSQRMSSSGSVTIQRGSFIQIHEACGSGKTQRTLPDICHQAGNLGYRTVVTAPTRAICAEVVSGLAKFGITASGEYAGGVRRFDTDVLVMPHAVLARLLVTEEIRFSTPTVFVVDESHSTDPRAQMLLNLVRQWATGRRGGRDMILVEMSATGYNVCEERFDLCVGSNYPIEEVAIARDRLVATVKELIQNPAFQRIMVFCPSVSGASEFSVERLAQALAGSACEVIKFHRRTFSSMRDMVYSPIKDVPQVILTTNMSEVGVNPEVDVVIDTCEQLQFVKRKGDEFIFIPTLGTATMAQRIQRRGRVGRYKEGVYIYVEGREPEVEVYSEGSGEVADVRSLLEAFEIEPSMPIFRGPHIRLSRRQAQSWISVGADESEVQSAAGAKLQYDENGKRRTGSEMRETLLNWGRSPNAAVVETHGVSFRTIFFDGRDGALFARVARSMQTGAVQPERFALETDTSVSGVIMASIGVARSRCMENRGTSLRVFGHDHSSLSYFGTYLHGHECATCSHVWSHAHRRRGAADDEALGPLQCPCCRSADNRQE